MLYITSNKHMPIDHMGQYIREEGEESIVNTPDVSLEQGVIIQKNTEKHATVISEAARRKLLKLLNEGK